MLFPEQRRWVKKKKLNVYKIKNIINLRILENIWYHFLKKIVNFSARNITKVCQTLWGRSSRILGIEKVLRVVFELLGTASTTNNFLFSRFILRRGGSWRKRQWASVCMYEREMERESVRERERWGMSTGRSATFFSRFVTCLPVETRGT